jgi:hypothetical protein
VLRTRSGPIQWVALGSSGLIILLVVLLVTHVITPSGETTHFDSVIRQMGIECPGQIAAPPAIKDEVAAGWPCRTPAGDGLMYVVTYVAVSPTNAEARPPTLTPDVVEWLCSYLGGDFLYARGDNYGLAVRPTTHDSQAYEATDRLGLHPSPHAC